MNYFANHIKNPLTLFLGWFVALHLFEIIVFPSMLHPNQVLSDFSLTERFTLIWTTNADTAHYMAIAKNGYIGESAAFFPLWPILIKLLGASAIAAKIAASFLTLIFLILFASLIKHLKFSKISNETIMIFLAWPASFLLASVLSEPLFLVCAAATLLLAEKRAFVPASLFAALASATRPVGIVLTIYLALRLFELKILRRYWWVLLVAPLGLVFYSIYLQLAFGDFTLFYTAQTAGWGRYIGLSALQKLLSESIAIIAQIFGPMKPVPINLLQVAVIPFSIFLAIIAFNKINRGLWIFSVLMIAIPISSGTYLAILREILAAFPLFIPFSNFLIKYKVLFYFYIFTSMLFQSLLIIRFFNYEWVA